MISTWENMQNSSVFKYLFSLLYNHPAFKMPSLESHLQPVLHMFLPYINFSGFLTHYLTIFKLMGWKNKDDYLKKNQDISSG